MSQLSAKKSYNNLFALTLKDLVPILTNLFFSTILLHHVMGGKAKIHLFTKIIKIQTSLKKKILKKFFHDWS